MDTTSLLLSLVIVAITTFLLGVPLLKETPGWAAQEEEEERLDREKESAFSALAELEFDYQMHKLDEADYEALKNKYKRKAVEALQQEEAELIDAGMATAGGWDQAELDEEIEAEIREELRRLRDK